MKNNFLDSLINERDKKAEELKIIDTLIKMYRGKDVSISDVTKSEVVKSEVVTRHIPKKRTSKRRTTVFEPRYDVIGDSNNAVNYIESIMDILGESKNDYNKTVDIFTKIVDKFGNVDKNMYQKVLENLKLLKKKNKVELRVNGNVYYWKQKAEAEAKNIEKKKVSKDKTKIKKNSRSATIGGLSVNEIAEKLKLTPRAIQRRIRKAKDEGKPLEIVLKS